MRQSLPAVKKSLDNVTVEVKSCGAGNDPPGSATSVTSTVSALLNGTGNT